MSSVSVNIPQDVLTKINKMVTFEQSRSQIVTEALILWLQRKASAVLKMKLA